MIRVVSGVLVFAVAALSGCASNRLHAEKERRMTVGIVQKEIHIGMTQPDVMAILGSPNIVVRDSEGREMWTYDKIATEASYRKSSGSVRGDGGAAGVTGTTLILGMIGGQHSGGSGASATTQRTHTVLIRVDDNNLVESFAYHASSF